MRPSTTIHLSLGSNLGDRFVFLQQAVDALHATVGMITALSGVFETPSWGFQGNSFYNCCIAMQTWDSPAMLLEKIMEIERDLGRVRKTTDGYEGRVIDLDILFIGDKIMATPSLVVPHPLIQDRKFVLRPLAEIAGEFQHPTLGNSVAELLLQTSDKSLITKVDRQLQNPSKRYDLSALRYLVIEGNIGVGKTSLAQLIGREFQSKLVLEQFEDNPFLSKFYKNPERYALRLELSFLADRYEQLRSLISGYDQNEGFVLSDYHVFKSLIFAQITLSGDELRLYKRLFDIMCKDLKKPQLYVYLHRDSAHLLKNIKKRGRAYEQGITPRYLEDIHNGYMQSIKGYPKVSTRIIDVTHRDFVNRRTDFVWILEQLFGTAAQGHIPL